MMGQCIEHTWWEAPDLRGWEDPSVSPASTWPRGVKLRKAQLLLQSLLTSETTAVVGHKWCPCSHPSTLPATSRTKLSQETFKAPHKLTPPTSLLASLPK